MTQQILAMALQLGQVSEKERQALEILCQAAETEMTGRLKENLKPEDCGPAFLLGCAWAALAGLAGGEAGERPMKFTAGELSIQEDGGDRLQRSRALRLQAETVLGPYLKDREFVFRGVEG